MDEGHKNSGESTAQNAEKAEVLLSMIIDFRLSTCDISNLLKCSSNMYILD